MSEPSTEALRPGSFVLGQALALRAPWLSALLAEPDSMLLHHDAALALVVSATGEHVALLTYDLEPAILGRIEALERSVPPGTLRVAVVGEGEDDAPWFRDPKRLERGRSFHHIGVERGLERLAGAQSKALQRAAARVSSAEPLSERELQDALARAAPLQRDAAHFSAAISGGFPPVTTLIGATCVAVFILGEYWGQGEPFGTIWRMGGNHGASVMQGEWWRLFASAFLHGNLLHLGVNMIALLSFGRLLEPVLGRARFLVVYALSALSGSLLSAAFNQAISVGASGAIWGLMTASIALLLRPRGLLPALAIRHMRQHMWGPLLLNVSISFMPGIDRYAHFGGGAVGFVLVLSGLVTAGLEPVWTVRRKPRRRAFHGLWAALAALLSLAMVGSLGWAWQVGRPWDMRKPVEFRRVELDGSGISVALPRALERQRHPTAVAGAESFVFGELPVVPVQAELRVERFDRAPDAALGERLLQQALAEQARSCSTPTREPAIEARGNVRAAAAECQVHGVLMWTWYFLLDDRGVSLTVFAMPERPAAWRGVERRILESITLHSLEGR